MLETLRAWLNGTRDYNMGVLLYDIVGTDEQLKKLFGQGFSRWNNYRLQDELTKICTDLKSKQHATTVKKPGICGPGKKQVKEELDILIKNISETAEAIAKTISPPNPELYTASKADADKAYKEAMNKRAVLFSMLPSDAYSDHNRADLIEARRQYCLDVVKKYNHASELYDQADFVKLQGRLPDQEEPAIDEEVANLEDFEVKAVLDNARKAYNKLKGREQNAERVALMQKHKLKIEKLEERWHSLKPRK